jgi:hypothetical protein
VVAIAIACFFLYRYFSERTDEVGPSRYGLPYSLAPSISYTGRLAPSEVFMETTVKYESEFVWRGWGTIPICTLNDGQRSDAPLPSALVTLVAGLEQFDSIHDDLALDCDAAAAQRLTDALWDRTKALVAEGRISETLPSNARELGRVLEPRAVAKIIATVVATGLEYTDDELPRERVSLLARTWSLVGSIRGARSVPRSIRIAEQAAMARRERGRCVQFATAARVLFYALKRATGAPTNVFVPAIYGHGADVDSDVQHAWNWLVDANAGSIAAFDVSAPTSRTSNDFQINLAWYCNVSAFLGSAFSAAIFPSRSSQRDSVRELLSATVEPRTERGQILLFHLADNVLTPINVRQWIITQLEKHSFERVVPDFKRRLTQRDESLGILERFISSTAASDLQLFEGLE